LGRGGWGEKEKKGSGLRAEGKEKKEGEGRKKWAGWAERERVKRKGFTFSKWIQTNLI
jgi:hypothetical protein